jgi:hypothetical protein
MYLPLRNACVPSRDCGVHAWDGIPGRGKAGVLGWDRHGWEEEYSSGVVVVIVCSFGYDLII